MNTREISSTLTSQPYFLKAGFICLDYLWLYRFSGRLPASDTLEITSLNAFHDLLLIVFQAFHSLPICAFQISLPGFMILFSSTGETSVF